MRKRFLRRMLFGVGALILLMIVSGWVLGAVFGGGWDRGPGNGPRGFFPFPLFLVAGLIALFLIVMRGVRRAAGPVGDVMEAVGRVADGDLTARVEARGGGDDRRLAHAFNRMAERLETDETRRRDLLADLAHELRTPLAVIRGNAEAMLDGLYPADPQHLRTLLDETDVLARLLDDLRTLSTAEAGALVLHREPVTPRALVDDVVSAFTTPAEERKSRSHQMSPRACRRSRSTPFASARCSRTSCRMRFVIPHGADASRLRRLGPPSTGRRRSRSA
jgi:signal transduction histidine kinase